MSINPTPEEIMERAMSAKEIMDSIIIDREADKALFTVKDWSIGNGQYEDEDGNLISREEAQLEADHMNRKMNDHI